MERMWMVRAEGGTLYDLFRERGVASIGWTELAAQAKPGMTRQQLIEIYRTLDPLAKQGTLIAGASQVWRFINEIQIGDGVVTYSPPNRT
jgi:restriction system protein